MRWFYHPSIRKNLTRIIMLTTTTALLLAGTAFGAFDLFSLQAGMKRDLMTLAEILESNSTAALTFNDPKAEEETLASLTVKPHVIAACIYDRRGNVFAQYRRRDAAGAFSPPALEPPGVRFARNRLVVFRPIVLGGEPIGTIFIESDLGTLTDRLSTYTAVAVAVFSVSLLVAFLLSSKLQGLISRPVLDLAHTAMVVSSEKDYSLRATRHSRDELGFLVDRFNDMLDQIQERDRDLNEEIAARRRAEAGLRETSQMLAALIEASPLAITAVDLAGKITAWNPAAERIFGWSEAEVKGSLPLHVPEDQREQRSSELKAVLRGEAVPPVETVRRRKDGTRVDVRASRAALRSAGGQVRGAMVLLEDITARKHAEAELKKAKEAAEAASRAKSEFLANMSHEIRTPLNGILGMTDLALETPLSPEQREYLTMVKSSADSLLLVINDVLDFSKIEAGKLDFEPIEFNLRNAIREVLNPLAVRAEQKGLEMVYFIAPDVPERLTSDPGRLRQILVNLAGNAVKFTERGDVLVQVQVDERSEREVCLHFRVRDTGIGIPPEQQQRIFEAFEQADTSMSRRFGGTGLGLTISARLVKMMRGRLWVESVPGQGSTFHFTARLGLPEAAAVAAVPAEPAALEGLSVLIVDDNATNRRILEEFLRNWRMHPESAPGGKAALARMQQALKAATPFRLVLIDACMPEMDGFELARRIKQDRELAGATVMMLSSGGLRGDAARCRRLGLAAYLTKPVTQSELLDAILLAMGQPAVEGQPQRVITRHTIREKGRGLRVLLAEDNPVNQHLTVRLLQKRGHEVVVVSNGRQALEAFAKQPFDLILMDVQMPEMDGFEATAAIRAKEDATGAHVPIIALTAHAMKGDKERCLAAGMDGYLAKPVRGQELTKMLEDIRAKSTEETKPSAAQSPSQPVADWDAALSRLEGDRELLAEMVDLFLADCPRLMDAIRDALARSDSKALERSAHTLKGTLANFAAGPAFVLARKLEQEARAPDLARAAEAGAELEKEVARFQAELASFRREVTHENPDR